MNEVGFRLFAVLRIWPLNDGGRRNPTLALFLTNGRSNLELDLADVVEKVRVRRSRRIARGTDDQDRNRA